MGEMHLRSQQNGGEISSGELRRGGPCGPTRVDIFITHDKIFGTGLRGDGESSAGKLFSCIFFGKSKTLPPFIGALSMLPVNKSVLGLQNPVT